MKSTILDLLRKPVIATILLVHTLVLNGVADEVLETLKVGQRVYTNVTVVSQTRNLLSITHDGGIASVKLADLEPVLQQKFGYRPPKPGAITTEDLDKAFSMPNAKAAQLREDLSPLLEKLGPYAAAAIAGTFGLLYLYFCTCAWFICRKLKTPGAYKAWFPVLQWEPLFRAAGMSQRALFWFVSPLLFGVLILLFNYLTMAVGVSFDLFGGRMASVVILVLQSVFSLCSVVLGVTWCFKITIARGKGAWLGLLLFLPVTSLFALGYIAFSSDAVPVRATGNSDTSLGGGFESDNWETSTMRRPIPSM